MGLFDIHSLLYSFTICWFTMPLHFIKSTKNKNLLLHKGYLYNKHHVTADKQIAWRCIEKGGKKKCGVLAYTTSEEKNGIIFVFLMCYFFLMNEHYIIFLYYRRSFDISSRA